MVPPPDDDEHDCGWKAYAKAQEAKLAQLQEQMAALERRVLGHWTCPSCWSRRGFDELSRLLGPALEITDGHGLAVTATDAALYDARELWRKSWPALAQLERARAAMAENALALRREVQDAWEHWRQRRHLRAMETERLDRADDAPASRPRPITLPLGATPEMIARELGLEVLASVGQGALGTVLAVREGSARLALKHIQAAASNPIVLVRLQRETEVMSGLSHPNIVKLERSLVDRGIPAFLMELVAGMSLRGVIHRGALPLPRALRIGEQVCAALDHAHRRGVVHRDVKPENILLDQNGDVKLGDFGIAKLRREIPEAFTLTHTGDVMGTPVYMAPEQRADSKDIDHRADLYSLGVVIHEMLTGTRPDKPGDGESVVLGPVEPRINPILARATAADPERRYGSAELLGRDLMAVRLGS